MAWEIQVGDHGFPNTSVLSALDTLKLLFELIMKAK
jgi:hypothetical protein